MSANATRILVMVAALAPKEAHRASRSGAPADLREAVVGPLERIQVDGVVEV
jgi:hypothetical protein